LFPFHPGPSFPTTKIGKCPRFSCRTSNLGSLIKYLVPLYTELDSVQLVSLGLQVFTQEMFFYPQVPVYHWSWFLRILRKHQGRERHFEMECRVDFLSFFGGGVEGWWPRRDEGHQGAREWP
jgi:hypothetical protein